MSFGQQTTPTSLEEHLVVYLGMQEGCMTSVQATLPPPATCSATVQGMYLIARLHLLTIIIIAVFGIMLIALLRMRGEGEAVLLHDLFQRLLHER